MERHFDEELNSLKERLKYMGKLAFSMISDAIEALSTRNESLIKKVMENEENVNRLHIENDDRAIKLLALYQPAARDLRTISAIMKINGELERIADQSVNISETTFYHLFKKMKDKIPCEVNEMADIARDMLGKSLKAFDEKDEALARTILLEDSVEDKLKQNTFDAMLEAIKSDPGNAERYVDCILICRNLEKIADHCTNIAEDVIFMILGKDIRHHPKS